MCCEDNAFRWRAMRLLFEVMNMKTGTSVEVTHRSTHLIMHIDGTV